MYSEAIFDNIALKIKEEIINAEKSIFIAVAWFTNKNIFDSLLFKAKNGCTIEIIISNDEINKNSSINYEELEKFNGRIYKIGNGDRNLMHNKFCIIDYKTVITGSYNWSYKAENNFENIVINYNDTTLAEQFVNEFIQIKNKFYPEEPKTQNNFPIAKIIKRLEILKNLIHLDDIEDLNREATKLIEYSFNQDINFIIKALNNKEYSVTNTLIHQFIYSYQQLSLWKDPEISGLKLNIKILESKLTAFDNEKIELEKLLSDFHYRHTIELGEIIIKILKLRKTKYNKDNKKGKEAEDDYNSYNEQFENEKQKKQFELNNEEKNELKQNFRKATMLCHPDKVEEHQKEKAEKIFIKLKQAYDLHDLDRVNQILKDLINDKAFNSQTNQVSEKDILIASIEKLRKKILNLEKEIIEIKKSDTFKRIIKIKNWDNYFNETKMQLEDELNNLTIELKS